MPMFQRPQSPCQPPRRHRVGAVAPLDRVGRGLQAGAVRLVGEQLDARAAEPRPEAARRASGALEWCRSGAATSRIAASRAARGVTSCRRSVDRGDITRTSRPAHWPWCEELRAPGTTVGLGLPTDASESGLAAHEGGRQVVVAHLGVAQQPAVEVEDLEHRLLVDPAGAEQDADPHRRVPKQSREVVSRSSRRSGRVPATRSIGHRASGNARERTERSSRPRTGPASGGTRRRRACAAWSRSPGTSAGTSRRGRRSLGKR